MSLNLDFDPHVIQQVQFMVDTAPKNRVGYFFATLVCPTRTSPPVPVHVDTIFYVCSIGLDDQDKRLVIVCHLFHTLTKAFEQLAHGKEVASVSSFWFSGQNFSAIPTISLFVPPRALNIWSRFMGLNVGDLHTRIAITSIFLHNEQLCTQSLKHWFLRFILDQTSSKILSTYILTLCYMTMIHHFFHVVFRHEISVKSGWAGHHHHKARRSYSYSHAPYFCPKAVPELAEVVVPECLQ